MRKTVGKWVYVVTLMICAFVTGYLAGAGNVPAPRITVINPQTSEDAQQLREEMSQTLQQDTEPLLIDINTADAEALDLLPGIGPVYAQRIVEYRTENGPFQSIEDIMEVSGIGEKKYEAIKELITVEDVP